MGELRDRHVWGIIDCISIFHCFSTVGYPRLTISDVKDDKDEFVESRFETKKMFLQMDSNSDVSLQIAQIFLKK